MSTQSTYDKFEFKPPVSSDSRSPCPALNTLANHGYIPRKGRGFTFVQLIWAMVHVYNISYPLAFLLACVGFLTSAKLSFHSHHCGVLSNPGTHFSFFINLFSPFIWMGSLLFHLPSWTLDLRSLSQRGCFKIAHDGSLVHPDGKPSTSPDPSRMENLLHRASMARDSKGNLKGGLDFLDIVRMHTENTLSTTHPRLSRFHEQVSLGETGLLWEVLRDRTMGITKEGVIPTHMLRQWLGKEQLPDGWWDCKPRTVGLWRARKTADEVARLSKQIEEEAGIRKPTIHDAISMD